MLCAGKCARACVMVRNVRRIKGGCKNKAEIKLATTYNLDGTRTVAKHDETFTIHSKKLRPVLTYFGLFLLCLQ